MPSLAYFLRIILDASVHFIVVFLVSSPAEVQMTPGLIECSHADMAFLSAAVLLLTSEHSQLQPRW